jgi:hypothetical protein
MDTLKTALAGLGFFLALVSAARADDIRCVSSEDTVQCGYVDVRLHVVEMESCVENECTWEYVVVEVSL